MNHLNQRWKPNSFDDLQRITTSKARTYFVFLVARATSLSLASRAGSRTMPDNAFCGFANNFFALSIGCFAT